MAWTTDTDRVAAQVRAVRVQPQAAEMVISVAASVAVMPAFQPLAVAGDPRLHQHFLHPAQPARAAVVQAAAVGVGQHQCAVPGGGAQAHHQFGREAARPLRTLFGAAGNDQRAAAIGKGRSR